VTLAQLVMQLQQLLLEQPQTADYIVVVLPHGNAPRQALTDIHQLKTTVQLEARS
jgi:hypothetical protein